MTGSVYHVHKDLGYMVFVLLILQFILVVSGAWRKTVFHRGVDFLQTLSVRIGGPLVVFAGFYLWHQMRYPLSTWWMWLAILFWVPIEIAGKRLIRPALEHSESESNSSRLLVGVTLQLVFICAIFGLMRTHAV